MRIFRGIFVGALIAVAGAASAQDTSNAAAQAAFERGMQAFKSGHNELAMPALTEAAAKGKGNTRFYAEFYLARIYSESAGAIADDAKAFVLFRKIADENAEIDPAESQRAPFVARALIALAGSTRSGLKDISLPANPRRAADYLYHAANYFGDREAQLELAKTYLSGDASKDDVRRGMHYLSALTEESVPAAQATLAEMFWRGRHVKQDEERALALITMAAESAPVHERMWIEDTYHSIYCAATVSTRKMADGLVARWRSVFARPAQHPGDRSAIAGRDLAPVSQ
jgi:TPR repeat protein